MEALARYYTEIWAVDFEFCALPGERPLPLCYAAQEVLSGRRVSAWLAGSPPPVCPCPPRDDILIVAYYASAELSCFLELGWPFPRRVLDLYAEFRNLTSGRPPSCGSGLLGALVAFGLEGMAAAEKGTMRQLAMRGGPFAAPDRAALLAYCESDVDALVRLLPVMLPYIDLPRALLRGRYMGAAARMEQTGVPLDVDTLDALRNQWDQIRYQLADEVNTTCDVFVPTGYAVHPTSAFGMAIHEVAADTGVDPSRLLPVATHLWHETRDLYKETRDARREARARTGLTVTAIQRWERQGHDASTWPDLDTMAATLAVELPALGLESLAGASPGETLWDLFRLPDARAPVRTDPALLRAAATLLATQPADAVPLTFSTARFATYLLRKQIPWPRLPSGQLALDDDTFREMARTYPADIGPIREVRHALSQLKLHELAVGHDGRNRCLLSAFGSRTGRNQPSNSKYIFGPSCWLRSLIQPAPGMAVAYVDWAQQELAIAAALSEDTAMMNAYQSGDFYLAFAQLAGAVPPGATKATHPAIREQFKIVALGTLYGLSAQGIARRLDIPLCDGRWLLHEHKAAFRQFWAWSDAIETHGMLDGSLQTVFGWSVYASASTTARSLRNFPMQANGAEMLRLACCLCTEAGIAVCAPVHDALLIEAPDADIEDAVAETQRLMQEASEVVLPGFPLRTEAKIVRSPERYRDPRGEAMWAMVQRLLTTGKDEVPF